MCDKPHFSHEKVKKLHLETTVSRKTIIKKYKKSAKRRNRRKRSRKTYLNMLKKERVLRRTEELCSSIEEFNVVDMDMKPLCELNKLPREVTEWQNQDQIAYWKSRAISLEIENKMLRQHLRNVYAQQIDHYERGRNWQELESSSEKKGPDTSAQSSSIPKNKVVPKEPPGKNRLREMEKIYGDKAQKIMGMETAIELNYERLVEEGSPIYWPNIPLKL